MKIALAIAVAAGAAIGGRHFLELVHLAAAYHAKTLCSGVFVAGRDADSVTAEDVEAGMTRGLGAFDAVIDREAGLVTSSLHGIAQRRALHRPGLGCTLVNGTTPEALRAQAREFTPVRVRRKPDAPWPEGEKVDAASPPDEVDARKLAAALDAAFAEPKGDAPRRTRAVVVVYRGRIVAERYADGFGPHTPLPGWSMGKGVANALTGLLVRAGELDGAETGLFPEWRGGDDPRAGIALDHLLRMTEGLAFDDPRARRLSDARRMMLLEGDAAAYARSRPAAAAPGESWRYGSGATVLLGALWRRAVGGGREALFAFPARALFAPLGMASAVIEPDAAGTPLAPAFVHASARDWARFGLFVLNDGVWRGERLLPAGWMRDSLRPTEASDGAYAAHFWRRVPDFLRPPDARERELPGDRFYMLGRDGQMVAVVPSRDLVVVRLGLTRQRRAWDPDVLLRDVLRAVPAGSGRERFSAPRSAPRGRSG